MMEYTKMHGLAAMPYRDDIRKLLERCDSEFVPPLSCRNGTKDMRLSFRPRHGIDEYLDAVMAQALILAISDGKLAGLMSYCENYRPPWSNDGTAFLYVSTVITAPEYRRQGITRHFYTMMTETSQVLGMPVLVRTWSTNMGHVSLLDRLKFRRCWLGVNDRGAGIDTVYYISDGCA